ncbi:acyltransferase family protein [Hoeflea sp. YIM 152468]|uniref:acyltransferase family protein n=1 Tax=Hoeflea sp. YIM 152468 TaxID=3031759 RepID=UPI0023D99063|nr:acyltransferase family protein [Hoeflea sp. YIM 152468]MDF1607314.1 acyltransferase family protein [Hoeflea sp. YIM 152468]
MSAQPDATSRRLHYWDFSRALYLGLGIPFHAAVIYSLSHQWSVSSPDKSVLLTGLADFIHTFRMPGFFILAGLFSMMLLDRQGAWPWLKSRLLRLGLPLLSATLLILPFQIAVQSLALAVQGKIVLADVPAHVAAQLSHFGEPWISHLWFLWVLIAYCAALALLDWLSGRVSLRVRLESLVDWVGDNRVLSLAAFAAICQLAAQAQTVIVGASPYYGNAVINYNLYVIFFGFGALVYASSRLHDLLLKPGVGSLVAGIALVTFSQTAHADLVTHTLKLIAAVIGAALIVGFISNMAQQHFSRPDARVRKLVDASFTIYLVHHPVIYVLATLFLMVDLPPVLEFAIIAPMAALMSYAIHQALSTNAIFLLMFNGVRPKAARTGPTASPGRPLAARLARPGR